MKAHNTSKRILLGIIIVLFLIPTNVFAKTSAEIAQDIINQKNALTQSENQLATSKANLDKYNNDLSGAQGGIPRIEAEINQLNAELEYNTIQLNLYSQNKKLKELEKLQREITRTNSVRSNYMEWRTKNNDVARIIKEDYDFKKNEKYTELVADKQTDDIGIVNAEVNKLISEISNFETKKATLEQKQIDLENKKKELEAQIAYLASLISYNSSQINGLEVSVKSIQTSLLSLSEKQRQAILREEEILKQNQGTLGNTDCLRDPSAAAGSLYLCGNGRDLATGHGVGMSQYGAKGAAEAGLNAVQILEFYYKGARVTSGSVTSQISVKYCENNPALDAYQDGCGDGRAPVTESVSFDTYLAGLGEMPDSWPVEARKAQIIAARTYAANYTNNGQNPICLTTYCQVSYFKNGDNSELALAQSTNGQVITYNGQFIQALYSADNNQGYGTADYGTRFQNSDGSVSVNLPYLTSVNDNIYAQNSRSYWKAYCGSSPCGLWKWKTFSYSMADIEDMFYHNAYGQWIIDIGGLASISFERDASLRVKRVYLNGKNGQNRIIGGWWFKYYWNIWVDAKGSYDYIYSQTYYLNAN